MFVYFIFVYINIAMAAFVCIYNGPGASDVEDYKEAYSKILSDEYSFRYINALDILEKNVLKSCALLVMPGGADLPYCEALNGEGNDKIRKYIEDGGGYFGTCAGAYYGSEYVLYDENNQVAQHIEGSRELQFCPGIARGPLFKSIPHSELYNTPMNVTVCLNKGSETNYSITDKCCKTYYFGGPFFECINYYAEGKLINILADYLIDKTAENNLFINPKDVFHLDIHNTTSLPAIVFAQVKKGRAVLSGVHLENNLFDHENSDLTREELLKIIFKKLGLKTKASSMSKRRQMVKD